VTRIALLLAAALSVGCNRHEFCSGHTVSLDNGTQRIHLTDEADATKPCLAPRVAEWMAGINRAEKEAGTGRRWQCDSSGDCWAPVPLDQQVARLNAEVQALWAAVAGARADVTETRIRPASTRPIPIADGNGNLVRP
jgi:hypothetical protein